MLAELLEYEFLDVVLAARFSVLFLAPRLPLPADTGGKIRTYNLLKQIAKFCCVHLICFSFQKEDEKYCVELKGLGIKVTLVPMRQTTFLSMLFAFLTDSRPWSVVKYCCRSMKKTLCQELNKTTYDVIHMDHVHMAQYIDQAKGLPVIIDEHNVEYKLLQRCANVEKKFYKRWVYKWQSHKMKKFETQRIAQSHACMATCADEVDVLKRLEHVRTPFHIVPNGVDTQYFHSSMGASLEEESLVFTGSMDWLPNEDAVLYFLHEILPLIWKGNPGVKFYIVGKDPSAAIQGFAAHEPRVIVTGRVEDVRPYIAKSKIFVAPLRIGAGTRLKILEAMSMEKAVVSTSIGAEGIDYTKNKDIFIAYTPKEFAAQVLQLLDDAKTRKELGIAGRQLILKQYNWDVIGQTLETIYRESVHAYKI